MKKSSASEALSKRIEFQTVQSSERRDEEIRYTERESQDDHI